MQLRAAHEFSYVASWRACFRVIDFHEANHTRHYMGLEFLNGSSRISEEVNFHIPGIDHIDPDEESGEAECSGFGSRCEKMRHPNPTCERGNAATSP